MLSGGATLCLTPGPPRAGAMCGQCWYQMAASTCVPGVLRTSNPIHSAKGRAGWMGSQRSGSPEDLAALT